MIKTPLSTAIGGVGFYTKNTVVIGSSRNPEQPLTIEDILNKAVGTVILIDTRDPSNFRDELGKPITEYGQVIHGIYSPYLDTTYVVNPIAFQPDAEYEIAVSINIPKEANFGYVFGVVGGNVVVNNSAELTEDLIDSEISLIPNDCIYLIIAGVSQDHATMLLNLLMQQSAVMNVALSIQFDFNNTNISPASAGFLLPKFIGG